MVMPVNPVDQMGDLVIKEGYQRPLKTDQDKQKAFNEYLVEEVFINNMFGGENSIYKPEPEEDAVFSGTNTALYGDVVKQQLARYIADNDLTLVKPPSNNTEAK